MKYDLHVHSKEVSPCGKMSVTEMVDAYKEKGYQGFWLTNHFHEEFLELTEGMDWKERAEFFTEPVRTAVKYAGDDFFVGLGMEIRFLSDPNDYLLIGVNERMIFEEAEGWLNMDLKSFYEKYHERLMIIQAHPNRRDSSSPADISFLHGFEAINSSPRHENYNEITQHTLCLNPRLIPTAGSDSHRPEDVGRTGIITETLLSSTEELLSLLKNRDYKLIDPEDSL